jgi:hypothetical protein
MSAFQKGYFFLYDEVGVLTSLKGEAQNSLTETDKPLYSLRVAGISVKT